jgi:hypothetical protein
MSKTLTLKFSRPASPILLPFRHKLRNGVTIKLCSSGVADYVELPEGCNEFGLCITDRRLTGADVFPIKLNTELGYYEDEWWTFTDLAEYEDDSPWCERLDAVITKAFGKSATLRMYVEV